MAIQVQGFDGTVAAVDGTNYRSMRTTLRPLDYGALGSYRLSLLSGTMAAGLAANSEVFQFRWSDATRICVVTSIIWDGLSGSATAFTSMGTTLLGAARISSTAALTAGTKTLDTHALAQYSASFGTTVSTQWIPMIDLFHADPGSESPLVLAQNEGFVIRATVPATGTWQFGCTVTWTELTAY